MMSTAPQELAKREDGDLHARMMALLERLGACESGSEYANNCTDLESAWNGCTEPNWLLWHASELADHDERLWNIVRSADRIDDGAIRAGRTWRERAVIVRDNIPFWMIERAADAAEKAVLQ